MFDIFKYAIQIVAGFFACVWIGGFIAGMIQGFKQRLNNKK